VIPNLKHISTRFVERQNLSVRMTVCVNRATNAFSKKIENHCAAVALGHFAYSLEAPVQLQLGNTVQLPTADIPITLFGAATCDKNSIVATIPAVQRASPPVLPARALAGRRRVE
jgi:hypothetical protein